LTGGSVTKINLTTASSEGGEEKGNNRDYVWDEVVTFVARGGIVGCSVTDMSGEITGTEESGGILRNLAYPIIKIMEVASSTGEMRMVQLKNPWGGEGWTGAWGKGSTMWEDYPEVYTTLMEGTSEEEQAYTFWMSWEDVLKLFVKIYVLRTFNGGEGKRPWRQYCLTADWVGKTAGGGYRVTRPTNAANAANASGDVPETDNTANIAKSLSKQTKVRSEADAYWFNNPQFVIRPRGRSNVHISLMQQDRRIKSQLRENYPIAFEVVRTKKIIADINYDHPRIWELVHEELPHEIVAESSKWVHSSHLPQREVSVSDLVFNDNYVYGVVPHPMQRSREGKFFLRIFADEDLEVEQIGETCSVYLPGSWDKVSERDTSGGPLRIYDEKLKAWKENAKWCQNPQFLLTTTKPRTAYDDDSGVKSIDIKIVIRRTDSKGKKGAGGTGVASSKRASRDDGVRKSSSVAAEKPTAIGVVVCKAPMSDSDAKLASQRRKQQDAKVNALGVKLPTKESSLKAARRKMEQLKEQQERAEKAQGGAGGKKGHQSYIDEDAEMTEEQMNPTVKTETANVLDRKLMVSKEEWSICTDYSNTDVSSVYMRKVDLDTLSDGLLIIPSMNERGVKGGFTMEVHTDYPVKVEELPESTSKTLAGEWGEGTAGGNHLNTFDWKKNPKYLLKPNNVGDESTVKITLSRNQKSWASQCAKDSIGCMIGFYIMRQSNMMRDQDFLYHDNRPWTETSFVALNAISTPEGFKLPPLTGDDCYVIVPATFDGGHKGGFFVSVVCDGDFSFKLDKGGESKKEASGVSGGEGSKRHVGAKKKK